LVEHFLHLEDERPVKLKMTELGFCIVVNLRCEFTRIVRSTMTS
jgi:hypothetical protein